MYRSWDMSNTKIQNQFYFADPLESTQQVIVNSLHEMFHSQYVILSSIKVIVIGWAFCVCVFRLRLLSFNPQ